MSLGNQHFLQDNYMFLKSLVLEDSVISMKTSICLKANQDFPEEIKISQTQFGFPWDNLDSLKDMWIPFRKTPAFGQMCPRFLNIEF
jgi:hypothetical protein